MPHLVQLHQRKGIWLNPDLSSLADVRRYLGNVVEDTGLFCLDDDDVQEALNSVRLAATELVSNVIRHGFPHYDQEAQWSESTGSIHVSAFINREDQLVVQVAHTGEPFDGNSVDVYEITAPSEGQMGLYIISQCVDHVYYATTDRGNNYVWLFRKFPPTPISNQEL